MANIGDVGTLRELDVKPGDVVCLDKSPVGWVEDGREYTCHDESTYGKSTFSKKPIWVENEDGGWLPLDSAWKFRIISRATPEPKQWQHMTPEEKGALLLARVNGGTVQTKAYGSDWMDKDFSNNKFNDEYAYRIKPEPVRETVEMKGGVYKNWGFIFEPEDGKSWYTHRITFTTIDGKPDCSTVKMDEI